MNTDAETICTPSVCIRVHPWFKFLKMVPRPGLAPGIQPSDGRVMSLSPSRKKRSRGRRLRGVVVAAAASRIDGQPKFFSASSQIGRRIRTGIRMDVAVRRFLGPARPLVQPHSRIAG